jgi:pimeloyl-ACP methyl ester carboxylesterase
VAIYARLGSGPPVVFISQLGTGGASWKSVIDRLPDLATFAYDRPGTGDAPGRPAPNPPLPHGAFAREFADLLDEVEITAPAILVGHSFGGNIARVYAGMRPERVAGLVFVDSSIPQSFLTPDTEPTVDGDGPDATTVDTVDGQVDILSAAIPDVPTIVLTRTHGRWDGENPPPHPAVEDLWLVSQRVLARDFKAPLIVADDCGHQLPRELPDLVACAVQAVLAAIASGSPVHLEEDLLRRCGGHLG